MSFFEPSAETEKIVRFLRENTGNRHLMIGVSGGIDSSVVLKLASMAVDSNKIHAFFMPESSTSGGDSRDLHLLSENTGIPFATLEIDSIIESYVRLLGNQNKKALGNLKSRIRMTLLYFNSNLYNGLVLGTTNRSEYMTGYFTKFGDGACDIEPIMHLYKTQVKEIAEYLRLPDSIIRKPPSAGLWADQTDETELGISYAELDRILDMKHRGEQISGEKVVTVDNLISGSEHKRKPPLSIEFGKK